MARPTPERMRRIWNREAATYDRMMARMERRFFPTSRRWVCSRAVGRTLEVGIGTGLNLPHYPEAVDLTAIEFSPDMLAVARRRAADRARAVDLQAGDAMALPFDDATFDTVVSTFVFCTVPDEAAAVREAVRVLKPGGRLLLADHVGATAWWLRTPQRLLEAVTIPLQGEHFTRRPMEHVRALGLTVRQTERLTHGAIEHVHATKPL